MESHEHSMERRRRQTVTASDVTAGTYSTVFVDTSLDTHLAMIVSNYDTVSDLKKKITLEHLQCFPGIGEIKIDALKVKRKGNFYHLSDSMLVSSAFEVGKRNWFVFVDAYSLKLQSHNQNSCRSEASNPLALICFQPNPSGESSLQRLVSTQCTNQKLPDADDCSLKESKDASGEDDADKRSDIKVQEKYEVTANGPKVDATNQKDDDLQSLEPMLAVKKKQKIKKKNDEVVHGCPEVVHGCPEVVGTTNSLAARGREVSYDMEFKSKDFNEDSHSRLNAKKKRKIGSTESSRNPSEIGTAEKIDRQSKKAKYEPLVQQTGEEKSCKENVEMNIEDFGNEELSEPVQEVVGKNNITCPIGTDMHEFNSVNGKENSNLPEAGGELNGSSKKKKTKVKKVASRKHGFSGIEQANDDVGETALPVVHSGTDDRLNDETRKDKSMLSHPKSKEISEQRPLDDSSSGAVEGDNMIESKAGCLSLGNTDVETKKPVDSSNSPEAEGAVELTVKVGGTKKKVKKVKKSAQTAPTSVINGESGDLMKKNESFLSRIEREEASSQQTPIDRELENMSENETDMLPLTQVNENRENAVEVSNTPKLLSEFQKGEQEQVVEADPINEVEKHHDAVETSQRKKKTVKRKHNSAAKSLPDAPNNMVGVDELTDVDPPIKTLNEPGSIKTSPANHLTRSELELEKKSGTKAEAKSDNQEQMEALNEGDKINFKDYFVPEQENNESVRVGKLEESARRDKGMKAKKNKTKTALSTAGKSLELQNKEKPKDDDYDLMPPPKKSLEVSRSAAKTHFAPRSNGNPNASDQKGPAKNAGTEKNGSQQEKSSWPTPCAIFSDDSRDSCADEKKSINSDASTRTPSDNSSSSESSMDSMRKGSSGPERKDGGKNISKSQSAGAKNITMDMIFRSSSRFKKAKLTALGESESQSVDFVPDSQPNP